MDTSSRSCLPSPDPLLSPFVYLRPQNERLVYSVDRFHPGISHQASRSWWLLTLALLVMSSALCDSRRSRLLSAIIKGLDAAGFNQAASRKSRAKVSERREEHGQLRSSFTRLGIVSISKGLGRSIVVTVERLLNNIPMKRYLFRQLESYRVVNHFYVRCIKYDCNICDQNVSNRRDCTRFQI